MAPLIVVVAKPGCRCCGALVVRGGGAAIAPLGLKGAVEAFDLPILLGAVGSDEDVLRAEGGNRGGHGGGAFVAEMVVGHHLLDVGMPKVAKCLVAHSRNAAQVAPFSSGRASE